ncbi:uncharacterized protein A4U43_C05F26160 [Asparagus officinalis]|uniref:Uncharacterized protein n=1 Tax=Asparagus officinalis TaxID=4686 RepID=A0A5P1EV92_ASPOF|nr:uncharacterized protein A4U43_C05F26160 [Asparagus officinalis]
MYEALMSSHAHEPGSESPRRHPSSSPPSSPPPPPSFSSTSPCSPSRKPYPKPAHTDNAVTARDARIAPDAKNPVSGQPDQHRRRDEDRAEDDEERERRRAEIDASTSMDIGANQEKEWQQEFSPPQWQDIMLWLASAWKGFLSIRRIKRAAVAACLYLIWWGEPIEEEADEEVASKHRLSPPPTSTTAAPPVLSPVLTPSVVPPSSFALAPSSAP